MRFLFHEFGLKMTIQVTKIGVFGNSNETRAPIANLPNSAQLVGTPYHSTKLHPGLCNSVGMRRGTDNQTHRNTVQSSNWTSDLFSTYSYIFNVN